MSPYFHGSYTSLATRARAHPCEGGFVFPNQNEAVALNACVVNPATQDNASRAGIEMPSRLVPLLRSSETTSR